MITQFWLVIILSIVTFVFCSVGITILIFLLRKKELTVNKIFSWANEHIFLTIILSFTIIALLVCVFILPVHFLYSLGKTNPLIETDILSGDILGFIGSFLAFIGTVFLGVVALKQTKEANDFSMELLKIENKRDSAFTHVTKEDMYIVINSTNGVLKQEAKELISNYPNKIINDIVPDTISITKLFFCFKIKNIGSSHISRIEINNMKCNLVGDEYFSLISQYKSIVIPAKSEENFHIEFSEFYKYKKMNDELKDTYKKNQINLLEQVQFGIQLSFKIKYFNIFNEEQVNEIFTHIYIGQRQAEEISNYIDMAVDNFNGIIKASNNTIINNKIIYKK